MDKTLWALDVDDLTIDQLVSALRAVRETYGNLAVTSEDGYTFCGMQVVEDDDGNRSLEVY